MQPGKDSRVTFAVGLAVIAVAALGLSLVLFNIDLDIISRWLAPWAAVPEPGAALLRLQSAATLAFGLAGGSLALSRFEAGTALGLPRRSAAFWPRNVPIWPVLNSRVGSSGVPYAALPLSRINPEGRGPSDVILVPHKQILPKR
jgi:hypothetical protein